MSKVTSNAPADTVRYRLQPATMQALGKVPHGTVNARSVALGLDSGEPLLIIADALLRYAKAYRRRFGGFVANDGVGGDAFRAMLRGVKVFLDFDGGVALERGLTTDSKDNAAMCDILQAACEAAGLEWEEL